MNILSGSHLLNLHNYTKKEYNKPKNKSLLHISQDVYTSKISFKASREPINYIIKFLSDFESSFDQAISYISEQIKQNNRGLVVLDIDGTVLAENYKFYLPKFNPKKTTVKQYLQLVKVAEEKERRHHLSGNDIATPRSRELIKLLEDNNIPYAYVSSRADINNIKNITEKNLMNQGLYGNNCVGVFLSPAYAFSRNVFKQEHFNQLLKDYKNILAMVGNSEYDFILKKTDNEESFPKNYFQLPA